MDKINLKWSISDLLKKLDKIEFPEFQREPTVWNLDKKRKLIDSILRNYDIASIYLHKTKDGNYECIDGRQRINAIISFLGLNELEEQDSAESRYDNNFRFKSEYELRELRPLGEFNNKKWIDLSSTQQKKILQYQFNVLELSGIENEEELNLMFLRLQLGAALNAGEKLNAMKGDMRNLIFSSSKRRPLGNHPYFEFLDIPKRRFSKELTAAQIALNFFSFKQEDGVKRARFVDLQEFLKRHHKLDKKHRELVDLLATRLDQVYASLKKGKKLNLKNRAIGVTTFFFIDKLFESGAEADIQKFIKFLDVFLKKLQKEVKKGIDIDRNYRDLLKFQTYISQAAVEPYAIRNRQTFLEEYFQFYLKENKIKTIHDS